ncbi:hypothetical protein [Bathymodiolus septemdierum thioautotrophic gill symbiont]|uniref:Porin domain-containing protein n=1 Tax=endosymbiont of Bathymodiolus septemdierum str. Myojin knoll TaxID=1303921 RepID=A0A0P0USA7_9GAMM|nr:hypothetical protein [Bathymodiolus septemdierum thioautotrophic gill symbiont]BAS67974.1 conserved hypothetical protein [endosymbiont of Bathymodiolus septemdierum str. Myojin knoll]
MKKLMIAAVAATMASASQADISIKGDAYIQYADNAIGRTAASADTTANRKRVNLNITGKSGATTVVISLRNDDNNNTGAVGGTGASGGTIKTHQFYMTTKVGPVNVKVGDFYGTIGLGATSKGASKKDALVLSTKFGATKVGLYTHDNSNAAGSTNVFASTKISGATVKVQHNPNSEAGWTNLMAKGTFGGILVAAEKLSAKAANSDTTLIHIGGKASGVKWDVAHLKNGTAINDGNAKFAPLGSMLVGTGARGGTSTAVANSNDFSKITGLAVSTKVAGNTIKAIFTSLKTASTGASPTGVLEDTVKGAELILTRAMSGGKLTVNLGKLSGSTNTDANATNKGLRFDVKF